MKNRFFNFKLIHIRISSYKKSYYFPDNMTHSEFDFVNDILIPMC